jgi:dihydrofolate reductase
MTTTPPVATTLVLIAAVPRNRVIGRDNDLVWHDPVDARHFRETTRGHAVIMGRRTWDSLPARFRPLPGRRNLVVTRQPAWAADGAEVVHSLEAALAAVAGTPTAFVMGGGQLYAQTLPLANELALTEIDADLDGDTLFPAWPREAFDEISRQHHAATDGRPGFDIVRYRRR